MRKPRKYNFSRGLTSGGESTSDFFKLKKNRTEEKFVFSGFPQVLVIMGQTATGKSALAVKMAKKIGGEIISADSRQVYKGLDIGTGKISKKEMSGIPHHLLDVANPKIRFTAAQYKNLAEEKIKEVIARGHTPIICGGTGFYIDAVTKGVVFPEVPPNNELRKRLAQKDTTALFHTLQKLDPRRAKNIDPKNKVRLIRAIEIAKALGKVPEIAEETPPYKFIKIGLYLPPDKLKTKVEKRVKKMFDDGLLNEIKKLKKAGVSKKRLQEFGFEYSDPTYEKVVSETLKYAKRQMLWFKRPARNASGIADAGGDKKIKWLDASKKLDFKGLIKNLTL